MTTTTRTEIRDGRVFHVTILPDGQRKNPPKTWGKKRSWRKTKKSLGRMK